MGKLKKRGGKMHKLYYLWIAWRRRLQEPAFIHENVCGLGDGEVQALLSDSYVIMILRQDPSEEGWASTRSRQYISGV